MPERRFRRARHQSVIAALRAFDAAALAEAACCFGGGTRIVLELDEYRESEDIDFLCASRAGYRALRAAISDRSLGSLMTTPLPLAREVRADRYGIRTFFDMGGSKLKMEIVFEGRIDIAAERVAGIPVPCLDRASCFAETYLANADRGNDEATRHRDVVDLAFMMEAWGAEEAARGLGVAREAYGRVVDEAATAVAQRLLADPKLLEHVIAALRIADVATLTSGLKKLSRTIRGSTRSRAGC
jgi:hypothetical protein